ncbi:MAG: c-type cytochrome [Saprospiraceae bacterium]|nr:c-type cytochrome [Saprospiraceae bacterium]
MFYLSCQSSVTQENSIDANYILNESDLPVYEQNIDHAQLIAAWDDQSYRRGEEIYQVHCFQCHGDQHQPGSLPDSRQFWQDTFKGGDNPYALYQTITRGRGQMPPQVQLVPQQKYDVIHFIREYFIKDQNPGAYFSVTENWLQSLPQGDVPGPDPKPYHPWEDMDYGNWLIHCYEIADDNTPAKVISGGPSPLANEDYSQVNFAYKGIAMRLDKGDGGISQGNAFAIFDHDLLRFAGAWTGEGFIDWQDILLNDQHNVYPRLKGKIKAVNPITPGWANPNTGAFDDPRIHGLDGRPFGPLPREWAHYKGLYNYNGQPIIQYSVDQSMVFERYSVLNDRSDNPIFVRSLHITANPRPLKMRILPDSFAVKLVSDKISLEEESGYHMLQVPAHQNCDIIIYFAKAPFDVSETPVESKVPDLDVLNSGGKSEELTSMSTEIITAEGSSAYDVDIFTLPKPNPWNSRVRPTGIDFLHEGKDAVVCTIDGEVWMLTGITNDEAPVIWKRIATGLFQPLGIKYFNNKIYVGCRDQIVCLHDLNGDEQIDYYQSFNSDHQVTEHFHEFAMGLQVDAEGNFYYAKSGRHARTSLVPQHGTLIKVSADGLHSTILANGFRAANGVCLNPDGSFFVTDQEGYWNPMNRINRVIPGKFYGNMWGYGAPPDTTDQAMEMPLCWIDKKYDRSPAELLWASSNRWGPLNNSLLSLSYGYGKIYVVLPQQTGATYQGGIIELPVPQFPTGLIRGRFNDLDGQLYVCGMSAWATNQMLQTGGLYRVRYNEEKTLNLPLQVQFFQQIIQLDFSNALDQTSSIDPANFQIKTWQLKRSHRYGSDRYDEKNLEISDIKLSADSKQITLTIPELKPTWIIEIKYQLQSREKINFSGAYQGSIYELEMNNL